MTEETDYLKYRGKCKEMSEALVAEDPTLRLVRGHFHCPIWGEQPHWWCEKPDGTIVDPTKKQFPFGGFAGTYEEFNGYVSCAQCGKEMPEANAKTEGNYGFCSGRCYGAFVGVPCSDSGRPLNPPFQLVPEELLDEI